MGAVGNETKSKTRVRASPARSLQPLRGCGRASPVADRFAIMSKTSNFVQKPSIFVSVAYFGTMARMFIGEGRGFGARELTDLSNVMTQKKFQGNRMSAGYFEKSSKSQANVTPYSSLYLPDTKRFCP